MMTSKYSRLARLVILALLGVLAEPAHAEKSSALLRSNPQSQYLIIKSEIKRRYESKEIDKITGIDWKIRKDQFDISECSGPSEMFGQGDEPEIYSTLVDTAYRSIVWRDALISKGYPAEVVDPIFDRSEIEVFRARSNFDIGQELLRSLNKYRKTHSKLPKIIDEAGCGAGGVSAKLRATPNNAQIYYITDFNYRLCKAQGLDADDHRQCDLWREAPQDIVSDWSGDFHYLVRWADGAERKGTFYLNADSEKALVVNIRKIE